MPVKIVTDSVSDIPAQVVKELGITIIPVLVRFGEDVYRDGIDISTDQFYDRLVHSKFLPATSVPAPAVFAETYDRLAEETDEIIAVMVTSKLSGIYDVASQSVGLMKRKCRVEVVDSEWAVMPQGFIVMKAAQAAQAGAGFDEVMDVIRGNITRVDMRAAFDTLEYLKKGGRIGKAQTLLGSMLRVNPIITLKDGVVEPAGQARSRAKAMERLYDFAASYSHIEELAVEAAACPEDSDLLVERLGNIFPKERIYRTRTTPVIGTYTGPGGLVVSVLGDK
jgi:DegV family protein with EDD domain